MSQERVEDFLNADQPIPGQRFVCLSFVSPENVLRNKDMYFLNAFLKQNAEKYGLDTNQLEESYKDFVFSNKERLESEFYEENNFTTTVRGLKVRGVYDTQKEAQFRAKQLQSNDRNFNVYVGQVGYWLPWDPEPHRVQEEEYAEQELNNLMKEYKKNQQYRHQEFQDHVETNLSNAQEQLEQGNSNNSTENLVNSLESEDPWTQRQNNES